MANLEFITEFYISAEPLTLEHPSELYLHMIGF